MDTLRQQIDLAEAAYEGEAGRIRCGCVVCGLSEGYPSRRAAGAAGWRAIGGNQSELVCPGCLAERDRRAAGGGNRRARLAAKAHARRARQP